MTTKPLHPPDDEKTFELLDNYLQELHAGRQPDRARLLSDHPELAESLECLEGLELLAPPLDDDPGRTLSEQESPIAFVLGEASVGSQFGKYELLQEIGRGGMGVIWKARQKDLDRVVAIKMILSSHLASALEVERFAAEARAMARLQHSNIVRIHESGEAHGQHFFVMEYIGGPSLAEVIRRGPVSMDKAASYVAKVARAVAHLHELGIVHRDLKPSNILMDEQDQPFVTDFGLVKMLGSSSHVTSTGAILGTPAYMAPEQATGRPEQVGPLSDVYSLGAILYELLTGKPPFQESNPLDTLVQVIEGEPTEPRLINQSVPRKLEMICLKCLEKAPEGRYASAAALADDLERFSKGEDIEARDPGLWQYLRRWARREPALVYRLAAIAILMVIVQVNFHLAKAVVLYLHFTVLGLLAAWAGASAVCQALLKKERWADTARLAWVGVDTVLLTALLLISGSQFSPLLVGYPFLIAASGLWFQVPVVWFTTVVCELTYCVLIFATRIDGELLPRYLPHYHLIFMATLGVEGFVMAYQVQRIRVLNRYYEHRPLP